MTGIVRTSVADDNLLIILSTGTQLLINKSVLDGLSEDDINNLVGTFSSNNGTVAIGVHRNRNGTYVVWTGSPPPVWPEDDGP